MDLQLGHKCIYICDEYEYISGTSFFSQRIKIFKHQV